MLFDVKNPRLQFIFNEEREEYEQAIEEARRLLDGRDFRYEVLLSFWLCIYLEKPFFAQMVFELDPVVEKVVSNLQRLAATQKRPGRLGKVATGRKDVDSERRDRFNVGSLEDLRRIKELLKEAPGATFNTNVMRIALNMQEEKIASIIVAYYTVRIEEEMVIRAIRTGQLEFL